MSEPKLSIQIYTLLQTHTPAAVCCGRRPRNQPPAKRNQRAPLVYFREKFDPCTFGKRVGSRCPFGSASGLADKFCVRLLTSYGRTEIWCRYMAALDFPRPWRGRCCRFLLLLEIQNTPVERRTPSKQKLW